MYEQCLNKLLPGRNMSFQLMIQRRGSRHVHRLTPSGAQAPALLTWMRKVPLVLEPNFFFIYQYLRIKITLSLSSIPPKCVLISDGAFIFSSCENFALTCSAALGASLPPHLLLLLYVFFINLQKDSSCLLLYGIHPS